MGRWKPGYGERYHYINSKGGVDRVRWNNDGFDHEYYEHGNCFRTRAEAEAAAEKVRKLLLSLHEPVTDCNQLPKLTAEVFDRPDCPEWANYAAVDRNRDAYYFRQKPYINEAKNAWISDCIEKKCWIFIGHNWDASDWQNSLIERLAKLPGWCKVGEWIWHPEDMAGGRYLKITEIRGGGVYAKEKEDYDPDYLCFDLVRKYSKQARLRPYNAEEMKALVGEVIEKGPSMHIVTGFENVFDNECMVHANGCLYSANDLLRQFTIDNKPAGVLEHLNENGEWIR